MDCFFSNWKPGKLDLKQFDNITDAIGRLNVGPRQGSTLPKVGLVNAPLATPESADLPIDYNKVRYLTSISCLSNESSTL